jgi:prophage DNA circulation protein
MGLEADFKVSQGFMSGIEGAAAKHAAAVAEQTSLLRASTNKLQQETLGEDTNAITRLNTTIQNSNNEVQSAIIALKGSIANAAVTAKATDLNNAAKWNA